MIRIFNVFAELIPRGRYQRWPILENVIEDINKHGQELYENRRQLESDINMIA